MWWEIVFFFRSLFIFIDTFRILWIENWNLVAGKKQTGLGDVDVDEDYPNLLRCRIFDVFQNRLRFRMLRWSLQIFSQFPPSEDLVPCLSIKQIEKKRMEAKKKKVKKLIFEGFCKKKKKNLDGIREPIYDKPFWFLDEMQFSRHQGFCSNFSLRPSSEVFVLFLFVLECDHCLVEFDSPVSKNIWFVCGFAV